MEAQLIVLFFVFWFGCCIGSFLNVVIYRMPRDKSIVSPPSACPSCGKRIQFYDNIPILSWIVLGGKCRFCKEPISVRYLIIELLTGTIFAGLFYLYFYTSTIRSLPTIEQGGLFIYLIHIVMISGLIAASAIDLQLWVIPVAICWFVTVVGIAMVSAAGYIIEPGLITQNLLLPTASLKTAPLAAGAFFGLIISLILLKIGLIKRSYESSEETGKQTDIENQKEQIKNPPEDINNRLEICREILFLVPIILGSVCFASLNRVEPIRNWWLNILQIPFVEGLMGGLWGYFVGCTAVWATRILGTLGFGKEAMGLGDMHLMGAAGAVIGPVFIVVAFFIAPFFGLIWALYQTLFKKTPQIPYGPFLSMGIFTAIIIHDRIMEYLNVVFYY